jgi:SpoVK/Ycf46/Vps4 family AAA+-type ATPase
MSNCYICYPSLWSYEQDYIPVDEDLLGAFHDLHESAQDIKTLPALLELLDIYRNIVEEIRTTVSDYHDQNCDNYCDSCGQVVKTRKRKRSSKKTPDWDYIIGQILSLRNEDVRILERLCAMRDELTAINRMVGLEELKSQFLVLIKMLAAIDDREKYPLLMNIVISGPPGHGKTVIAKLIGTAFRRSGFLSSDKFVIATRADLIGAYCGHTAKNTTAMFDKARGGVIFIDEVYSLGNTEKRDVFTGECIDTINQLLGERTDTLCIVAGYEEEIYSRFFSYNPGLERRFPWRFTIRQYTAADLAAIFYKLVEDVEWRVTGRDILQARDLEGHLEHFENAGGDMANLLTNCLTSHYDNQFLAQESRLNTFDRRDILSGLEKFLTHKRRTRKDEPAPPPGMYM